MIASRRSTGVGLALVIALGASLEAQRRGGATAPAAAKSSPNMTSVRAELAAVLLQSRKYAEAAREYRGLLARDTTNFEYRLGLARALAWGGHAREAERELRVLQAKHLQIATVDSMLRAVRADMEPRSSEAASWVAERPTYAPYRVALARAYAHERFGRLAAAQYDTLLFGTSLGPVPDPLMLRRERARAYLDAGDLIGGAASLRDVLRMTPADTSVRHELAVILSGGAAKRQGRAQYDTLLATAPTAALFTERARLRYAMNDSTGAESDLLASLPLGGTAPAFLMLGDLYRSRGDYGPARSMYRLALTKLGGESISRASVEASIAQLAREERPVVAFTPALGDEPGWRVATDGVTDNLGVRYAASTLRGTFALGQSVHAGLAVLHQYLAERSDARAIDLSAVGVAGSLGGEVGYGPFLARAAVEGGGLHLPQGRVIPIGTVAAATWLDAWQLGLATSTGPAYPSLLTTAAWRPIDGPADDAITERDLTGMLGGPLFATDIAVSSQLSRLSDGNRRATLEAYLRVPLAPGVSFVYNGTRIAFAERSTRYWDPIDYVSHAAGLELATHASRGLSAAVRALPGAAWSVQAPPPVSLSRPTRAQQENIDRTAFQLTGGGELTWRDPSWEGVAAVTYGRGRAGDYRRVEATLGVRILP